jgi:hypothetical protein
MPETSPSVTNEPLPMQGKVMNIERGVDGKVTYKFQDYDDAVAAAQKQYPNKAGKIELHHIEPKYIGGAKDGTLVPIDGAYHQVITNEFRNIRGYGLGHINDAWRWEIMNQVYTKYPLPPGFTY